MNKYPCLRPLAVALLCLASLPAGADVLYQWVRPDGVVVFSDVPPGKNRGEVRFQILGSGSGPAPLVEQSPLNEEKLRAEDPAVQRAGALVDLAERALAAARRPFWTKPAPGHLTAARMTRADRERIAFYQRNSIVMRRGLLEVLQQKHGAAARGELITASYEVKP